MRSQARSYLALMSASVGAGAVARLLGLQVLIALMEGLGLTLLAPVLQSLGGADDLRIPQIGVSISVPVAFTLVLLVMALRAVAQWRAAVLSVEIRLTTIDALRLRLVEGLFDAQWSYLAGQRQSHVVQRLTSEVERAHNALVTLTRIIVGSLVLGATVLAAVLVSPAIGGAAAVVLLLVAAATRRSLRTAARLGEEMTEGVAGFGAAISDSLASVRLTRAHDAARAWTALVGEESRRMRDARSAYVRKTAGVVAALSVTVVLAVLVLVLVGREAGMAFAELAALVVIASRVLTAAQGVLGSAQMFANDAPALDALSQFEREIEAAREPAGRRSTTAPRHAAGALISLVDVSVRHTIDGPPVLAGVTVDVPRHALVAVSGPSGSGKSTLLDVVLGLLPPDSGDVLIDGTPLGNLAAWRARVGYVPQQTVLVPGSVWQNLIWSLPPGRTVTHDDAWAALQAACLDEVVAALPGGLEAPLRDLAELSGGEQQRLSIARALIRDPELLVLDEATSALDPATEERVLDNILDGRRTVLLVTHRPSDRARADVNIHLDHGSLTVGG